MRCSYTARHAGNIVPEDAWEKRLGINDTPVWFLIRSTQLKLEVVR